MDFTSQALPGASSRVKWIAFVALPGDDEVPEAQGVQLPGCFDSSFEAMNAAEAALVRFPNAINYGSKRYLVN